MMVRTKLYVMQISSNGFVFLSFYITMYHLFCGNIPPRKYIVKDHPT